MGFRPMMSSLLRNKTGPVLVALPIAVTLAIVINSLFIIVQRIEKMNRDPGLDVENVIVVYARGFGADFDVIDSIRNDIDVIKSIPGVVAATVSNQVPLSGSGSGTGLRAVADEAIDAVSTGRYRWSEEGLDSLGIELSRGRNFFPEEVNYILPESSVGAPPSIIVTQDLADELFRMRMHWERLPIGATWRHQPLSVSSITCMDPGSTGTSSAMSSFNRASLDIRPTNTSPGRNRVCAMS